MSNVEVKIEGLKELERELAALPDKIGKRVLRKAVRDGSQMFLAALQARVPEASGEVRGALGIVSKFKQFTFSAWMGAKKGKTPHHSKAEPPQILRFLEKGTGAHISERSGKLSRRSQRFAARGHGIKPRKFIEKSFAAVKERALALVVSRLAEYIAKYRPGA